ncbi:UNVERIFIED_CONTAM: Heme-binding-like protein, chloroplastic [Sesamum angustifolium]|uniref:Heme-binding-like protein, chloroplastic n=1 Tax=Sesamum angustifolium TaxID=2727405 RepID=A0AAW2MQV4_9LAMI
MICLMESSYLSCPNGWMSFLGFVTDEEVERRESSLRDLLNNNPEFHVKEGASVEVAQYNPPFALLSRCDQRHCSLEVERKRNMAIFSSLPIAP